MNTQAVNASPVVIAPDASVARVRGIARSRWTRALELCGAVVCLLLSLYCVVVLGYVSLMGFQYGTYSDPVKVRNNTLLLVFCLFNVYLALSFIEGRKHTALYLRRFRSDVNSFIAATIERGLGRRFRILTLDDQQFVPIEVPRLEKWSSRVGPVLLLFAAAALTIWGIRTVIESEFTAAEGYTGIYAVQFGRMFGFWTRNLWCLLFMLLAHRYWIRRHARVRVRTGVDLVTAEFHAWKLRAWRNRPGLMAPQATIVTVIDRLWRDAIMRLTRYVDLVLVDCSDPSEALVWEVAYLKQSSSVPTVFVAEATRFHAWTGVAQADSQTSGAIMLQALARETILLYTHNAQDKQNAARFKRNLGNTLIAALRKRTGVVSTTSEVEDQRFRRLLTSVLYYGSALLVAALTGTVIKAEVEMWLWRLLQAGHLQ
jgi:hypothetical protein